MSILHLIEQRLKADPEANELYHVTSFENATNILKHDYFRPSTGTKGHRGLSTTTDPNYWWGTKEVRFVIDRNKAEQQYDLIPVDEELGVDESEILIQTDSPIKPASQYIARIEYVMPDEEREGYQAFREQAKDSTIHVSTIG